MRGGGGLTRPALAIGEKVTIWKSSPPEKPACHAMCALGSWSSRSAKGTRARPWPCSPRGTRKALDQTIDRAHLVALSVRPQPPCQASSGPARPPRSSLHEGTAFLTSSIRHTNWHAAAAIVWHRPNKGQHCIRGPATCSVGIVTTLPASPYLDHQGRLSGGR